METSNQNKAIKGSFWGALAFYLLIAFEFFYMAGPFAMYFYSVYAPVLNFLNRSSTLAWLSRFFLPHAVRETSSFVIGALEIVGVILTVTGFLAFCIGAGQVYYHKLAKKGIVTGGIYNRVRHPQYASFIVCSFGLLLLWPRYIVAIMFVTMLFFYYLLAKMEENECERKFGQSYVDFKNRTGMFFPVRLSFLPKLPQRKGKKALVLLCLYMASVFAILVMARSLNTLTIDSLYATYSDHSANVSVCELPDEKIDVAVSIALSDKTVAKKVAAFDSDAKFINYVLPTEWYAAEIPMNGVHLGNGHAWPSDYNPDLFKVILTKADLRGGMTAEGKDILTNVALRTPIAEVWVDLSTQTVIKVLDMPEKIMYQGVPVAVF